MMQRHGVLVGWVLLAAPLLTATAQTLLPDPTMSADVARGQALFESRCGACHSLDANRVGPALRFVVGRTAGKARDYVYSGAMARASHTWSSDKLMAWLGNPENVVPGQAMNYRLDLPQDRADVVAYLASLAAH